MNKQITSILLVAGTCIGAGMIALPMSLAKLGILPSIIIMIATWFFTYYSSLVSVELNLHSECGLTIGLLGKKYSGKTAHFIGEISVKLLSYALLAAYIYGCSSIIQQLISIEISSIYIQTTLSILIIIALLFKTHIVAKINNIAFTGFALLFIFLIVKVVKYVDYSNIQWTIDPNFSNISSVATIVFTSFGYQVIFHTLRNYCGKNIKMLKRAFLYGSIIPMFIYILWTCGVLSIIYNGNPDFFQLMISGKTEVGELISELAKIFKFSKLQIMIWWISIFTILTSIVGVGVALSESYYLQLKNKLRYPKLISAMITIIPPFLFASIAPNAFIKALSIAGTLLVIIAILLPIYLFFRAKIDKPYISILNKWILLFCVMLGFTIISFEIYTAVTQ